MPWNRKRFPLAIAALLGLCAAVAPAGAVDAAKPVPCAGLFATDAADDSTTPGGFTGSDGAAQPNMEQTGFFFNYGPDKDGKPVLTANMVLKNLDKTVPDPYIVSGGLNYYFHWESGGEHRFVKAENPGTGTITYGYGTVDDEGVYTTAGDTVGAFFEGPDGVVQIDVPEAFSGKPGDKLEKVVGVVDTIEGQDDFFGFNHHADGAGHAEDPVGVNPANGVKDYTVTACPPPTSGGGGTTPPPGGGGGGTTPPPSGGGGGTTPPPSGGGTTPPPLTVGALDLKVPKSLGSARKAKKKKSLTFKVTAGETISNLKVALKPAKGGPSIGKATKATVNKGTSKLKLKVSRKIKKGKYLFAAQGTVNGQVQSMSVRVTVKK